MTQLFNGGEVKKSKMGSYIWIAVFGVLAIAATMNYRSYEPKRQWITIKAPNPPRALAEEMPRISQRQNGVERGNDLAAR